MWLLIVVACISFIIYRWFVDRFSYFSSRGIPGPTPHFPDGHLSHVNHNSAPLKLQEWTKQYGQTFGYFEGTLPVLVTSNLDILYEVFVKKFDHFHGRKIQARLGPDPDHSAGASVFLARGLRWKRLRSIASPAFSNFKLKQVLPLVQMSDDALIDRLDVQANLGQPFDIFPFYQEFTLDTIASVAFGITDNLQGKQDNPTLDTVRLIFTMRPNLLTKSLHMLSAVLPQTLGLCRWIGTKTIDHPAKHLVNNIERVVQRRKQKQKEGNSPAVTDFIQLFMDAEAGDETDMKESLNIGQKQTQLSMRQINVQKKLTSQEIVQQCFVFLLAGYDTTANTMAYATHLIMTDQRVQDKLYEEIINECANQEITFDALQRLKYLEMTIKETLRLYPLASIVNSRECMTSCELGSDKLQIDAGTFVAADVWTIHHDPTIWGDDAHLFRPERFEDNPPAHPMAWMPFGAGPRTCVGMRLAMIEAKLTLATIIRKYSIHTTQQTQIPLKYHGTKTISPENVFVKLIPRE